MSTKLGSKPKSQVISQPLGKQTPQLLRWKDSLRSTSPEGAYLTDVPTKSHGNPSTSQSIMKRSGSFGSLRKSGNLAANFTSTKGSGTMNGMSKSSSQALERIETEYIKNLQQQIYFLELESSYLREQAAKATEMHPVMTSEAERMLQKLRHMQSEYDGAQLEIQRNTANVQLLTTEKERLLVKLKAEEDSHQREKRLLLDENVQLRKEKDIIEKESSRKDSQILQANSDVDKVTSQLRASETNLQIAQNQLKQTTEQLKLAQQSLEEKRAEALETETRLYQLEEKYYSSSANIADKINTDLREEIRSLQQKVKEAEMSADQDRFLRTKISDDSSHLIKENAVLSQQVLELQKQLERERAVREDQDSRRSQSITDMVLARDHEKTLQQQVQQLKDQLHHEQQRNKQYVYDLAQHEQACSSQELTINTTLSRLTELEAMYKKIDEENTALRRDKTLLVDHISDLQSKLNDQEQELSGLRTRAIGLETRAKDLENMKVVESSLHSQKWDEFSRLADSMKSLSRSMARTASPRTVSSSREAARRTTVEYS